MSFAERYGFRPTRVDVQTSSLDHETRTALWNVFHVHFLLSMPDQLRYSDEHSEWFEPLWVRHFKGRLDELPDRWHAIARFETIFFSGEWYDLYSLLEAAAERWPDGVVRDEFRQDVNRMLEFHLCGHRFVGNEILELTDEHQIAAITTAQADASAVPPARAHLARAASLLNDRHNPDHANSIKESIAAVEAAARFVTGKPKATLADALRQVTDLHPALREGWLKLYGYTSDAGGIRHAASDDITPDADHALYFLVTCSAFVSFLLARAANAAP